MSRTYIYVDGFNLYYGALRKTSYKWLDIMSLCRGLLKPDHEILKLKYFTARVHPTPQDPQKHIRQQTYIRALEAFIPQLDTYYGHFLSHTKKFPLAHPKGGQCAEEVIVTNEKGSDVNLALHFLNDAWLDTYDCGVIISNDSDLAEAVRLVRLHKSKTIGIINPQVKARTNNKQLCQHASFTRRIRQSLLAQSQLPEKILGTTITKPGTW